MGVFQNNLMGAAAAAASAGGAGFYTHQIANSVRMPAPSGTAASNSHLTRTVGTVDSNVHWTLNFWIKRSAIGGTNPVGAVRPLNMFTPRSGTSGSVLQEFFFGATGSYGAGDAFAITNTNVGTYILSTNNLFRDTSAWYNIHIQADLDNGTAGEKLKIFINGTEASYNVDNRSSYTSLAGMVAGAWTIGDYYGFGYPIQSYLAQWCYIDGTTYAASDFGETKNGVWIPKDPSGLTFGSEGFYLKFESSSDLGNDSSGNNNDWTAVNLDTHDQMLDSPTFSATDGNGGNFCTINPLNTGSNNTVSEGNLKVVSTGGGCTALGTMDLITGYKWYFEARCTGSGNNWIGIIEENGYTNSANTNSSIAGSASFNTYLYAHSGLIYYGSSSASAGATFTTGDVMGVLVDLESATNTIQFYKGGAAQGSAFSLTGTGINYTAMSDRGSGSGNGFIYNFGSDSSFAGAETAGSNTDSSGKGEFLYDDSTGGLAICAGNLTTAAAVDPAQTDDDYPQELFFMSGYNGNLTGRTITTENQPDLLMIRHWTTGQNWYTLDSTRVITDNKYILTNTNAAEATLPQANITSVGATSVGISSGTWLNSTGSSYQMWMWRANGGSLTTNDVGTQTSYTQTDPSGGFSITKYVGTGSAMTVGHGLSVEPKITIIKDRDATVDWVVYTKLIDGSLDYLLLDTTAAAADSGFIGPNSSIWNFNAESGYSNTSGRNYIMYNFTDIEGYIHAGIYEGNGNADGAFVYTGFRPAFIMTKSVDSTSDWQVFDDLRAGYNVDNNEIAMNEANAQSTTDMIDILSNGFKMRIATDPNVAETYVYLAFAENPFQYATAR